MAIARFWRFWAAINRLSINVSPFTTASIEDAPTITAGSAAPSASEPKGSLYLRIAGADAGQIVYVATDSAGTWSALTNTAVAAQVQTAGGETYVLDLANSATGEALVKLADNKASAFEIKEAANSYLKFVTADGAELITFGKPVSFGAAAQLIADPGDAGAIPVTHNGVCAITTAGDETRTVADPTFIGQRLTLCIDVDGGSCVVTFASAINQTGDNTATMNEVKDFLELVCVQIAGVKVWRVASGNDGAALSTV